MAVFVQEEYILHWLVKNMDNVFVFVFPSFLKASFAKNDLAQYVFGFWTHLIYHLLVMFMLVFV